MRVAARWQLAARPFRSGIAKRGMAKSGEGDGDGDGRRWTAIDGTDEPKYMPDMVEDITNNGRSMDDRWANRAGRCAFFG